MAIKYGNTVNGAPSASFTTNRGQGTNYIKGNADVDSLNSVDVTFNETARISAEERAKIIPNNIVDGVTILGVTGTAGGGGGGGSEVVINPTLTGNEDNVSGIEVDGTKYKVDYQAPLVSGTNIKTINNQSILGSGNIEVAGDSVEANPSEEATESITKIKINGVVYSIEGGSADLDELMQETF